MLLQVKASLPHGRWLPWLKQQQESGAIGFSHKTATKYMNLAANMNHGSYLSEAPSIRAALELLSDKEPLHAGLPLILAEVSLQLQTEPLRARDCRASNNLILSLCSGASARAGLPLILADGCQLATRSLCARGTAVRTKAPICA